MTLKTLLNRCHPLRFFVYGAICFVGEAIHVEVRPRSGSRGHCSGCEQRGSTYDTARTPRLFAFVPAWGFEVSLVYRMRRIDCPACGVTTEVVPWADGKNRCCKAYRLFLARWARRLPWSEVAAIFKTTWPVVYRAVDWVVDYGLTHRSLDGVRAIGIDEVSIWKGSKFLTVVYQIDSGSRRLLYVAKERTEESLRGFFDFFGEKRSQQIEFVASDMRRPYLKVIADRAKGALHVLDRFHIVSNLGKAVNEVRAQEARAMLAQGYEPILKNTRWCFLKRSENLTDKQSLKLNDVLQYNLRSVRAYLLKESFDAFWTYTSPLHLALLGGLVPRSMVRSCNALTPRPHEEVCQEHASSSRTLAELVSRQEGDILWLRRGA